MYYDHLYAFIDLRIKRQAKKKKSDTDKTFGKIMRILQSLFSFFISSISGILKRDRLERAFSYSVFFQNINWVFQNEHLILAVCQHSVDLSYKEFLFRGIKLFAKIHL